MKKLIFILALIPIITFGQAKKSVLTQAQKDSIEAAIGRGEIALPDSVVYTSELTPYVTKDSVQTWAETQSLLQTMAGVVYVVNYINENDTTTSWNDAIQAAIDVFLPEVYGLRSAGTNVGGKVVLPNQRMGLTSPIQLYSGVRLVGSGNQTELYEKAGFVGNALLELKGIAEFPAYVDDAKVKDIKFTSNNLRAVGLGSGVLDVVHCTFEDIHLRTKRGFIFDQYTQFLTLNNIFSTGASDTLLYLFGNDNHINGFVEEGTSVAGATGAAIYLVDLSPQRSACVGNTLENILLEGGGSPNQSGIILRYADKTQIINYWNERAQNDGYLLRLEGCFTTQIDGYVNSFTDNAKLKVDSSEYVYIDQYSSDAIAGSVYDTIEKDSLSTIIINLLYTRGYYTPFRLDKLASGFTFNNVFARQIFSDDVTGLSKTYKPQFYGKNMFQDTFESPLLSFDLTDIDSLICRFEGDSALTTAGWDDMQGNHDLTFSNSPTISSHNGIPSVIFNGIDESAITDSFALDDPITVYMVWKPITHNDTLNAKHIYDGLATDNQSFFSTADPELYAMTGNGWIGGITISTGLYNISQLIFDGTSSSFSLNGSGKITGDAGGGFTDGIAIANGSGIANAYPNMEISALLLYHKRLSDYENNLVIDYLNNKYNAFETKWAFSSAPDTLTEMDSELSDGKMIRIKYNTAGSYNIYQPFNVKPSMVGKEFTFSVYCKADTGATTVAPYLNGCGFTPTVYMRASPNGYWYILTQSFVPQSSGTIFIGVGGINLSEIYLDNPYLTATVK